MSLLQAALILLQAAVGAFQFSVAWLSIALLLTCIVWILRIRHLARLRQTVRRLYGLSEEVLSAASADEIQERLSHSLPSMMGFRSLRLWLEGRMGRPLEPVGTGAGKPPESALLCFRSGQIVREDSPRRRLWLPMQPGKRPVGVLELQASKSRLSFHLEEEAALQHLANQIAIGLQLIDQAALREQVTRNERLGAVGQLISAIASEIQPPIVGLAESLRLLSTNPEVLSRHLEELAGQSTAAAEAINRLVSFGRAEQSPPQAVELNGLIRGLESFRRQAWRLQGIELTVSFCEQELNILASPGQLEQALLGLLVQAEQSMPPEGEKRLSIATQRTPQSAVVDIAYTAPERAGNAEPGDSAEAAMSGLGVAQQILHMQAGTLRTLEAKGELRLEIELPLIRPDIAERRADETSSDFRSMTFLLLEPDAAVRRPLTGALAALGQRVVSVQSGDEALSLAGRLQFDAIISTNSLPGDDWYDLFEHSRRAVPVFVLMHENLAVNTSLPIESGNFFLLRKPVAPRDLEHLLSDIESRIAAGEAES